MRLKEPSVRLCCIFGSMRFREEKATALASFFLEKAGGELEYLKLLKLMYLVERESLRVLSASVTGDVFYSMKHGPVMSATFDLGSIGSEKIVKENNDGEP